MEVTISVPGGEEMAKKTLNARLGILGGISILGTTGIVRPYSTAAFRASVVQAVDVAANQGQTSVVFTTGGRTEKFAMRQLAGARRSLLRADGRLRQGRLPDRGQAAHAPRHRRRHGRQADQDVPGPVGHPRLARRGRPRADRRIGAPKSARRPTWSPKSAPPKPPASPPNAGRTRDLAVAFHRALAERAIRSLRQRYPGPYRLTVLACDFEGVPSCRVEEHEALS
jgi:cobalt-precorrin-5B (C1)-methyltransferase